MAEVKAHVTSLRQVDRIKATTVGKSYPLTLIKEYVSKWGLLEAVRELIQNALDSPSPFVFSWIKEDDAWTLMLNSELTVLSPQTLLLGATTKSQDSDSIGSFGEGYKLALLVLTRLGVHVDMLNGDVLWRPVFRYNRNFDSDLLHIDESFLPEKGNKGLTFYVRGLSQTDKENIEQSCIRMQTDIGAIKQTEFGDILLERKGRLYVGGLFICDMPDFHYGYNIKPKHITLERDRRTVDSFDLASITTKMWYATNEPDKIAEMISKSIPDVEHARYGSPDLVKEACYKIFREKNPNAFLADSPDEAKEAVRKGLVEKVYIGGGEGSYSGSGYYSAVSSSSSYRRDVQYAPSVPPRPTPEKVLLGFVEIFEESMTRQARQALHDIIEQAKNWRLL